MSHQTKPFINHCFIHSILCHSILLRTDSLLNRTTFHLTTICIKQPLSCNIWSNELTFSPGLLLLLLFAEQTVISSNCRTHNLVASGIFIQDCMIVKPVKTWLQSSFNKLIATFLLVLKLEEKKERIEKAISLTLLYSLLIENSIPWTCNFMFCMHGVTKPFSA